jgi:glutaminyl-peptide cyclotransferase
MISPVARRSTIVVASVSLVLAIASCGARSDAPRAKSAATPFNADSAMSYVRQQLAFGPRVPGTTGARKTGDWIVARLRTTADTVVEQTWTATTSKGDKLPLRNIFARFRPQAAERVLYVTHWDTRPFADSENDPAKQKLPIPGANDGASGVALLLAVADALKKTPPGVGVDLLFVDGEDYGTFTPDVDVLLGSTYFAEHLPTPDYKPLFGVLWDMIGDADLQIYQEVNSVQAAPEVVQRVWEKAKELGYEKYVIPEAKNFPITDDHVPLIKAGLRVIDVIDIDYECHHKLCDDVDKVSAKSLGIVGDLALALVMK